MTQKTLLNINWRNTTAGQVRNLLAQGAKANAYSPEGWTPLMTACRDQAPLGVIKVLVQEGKACVNAANPQNGITALMLACGKHSSSVVRFLLQQGADKDISDRWGWYPMTFARRCAKKHNIKCLQDHARQRGE